MTFDEILEQVIALLKRQGRVSYRALKMRFEEIDDEYLDVLKEEILYVHESEVQVDDRGFTWTGETEESPVTPIQSDPLETQPVVEQAQPTSVESPSSNVPEAERRQLTVMFVDLVDSTRLSSELDPEIYREIVREYQRSCSEVIAKYDGNVAQLLGDGLLVYFGYPVAHEDDAQRAVRSGLGIIDAIENLNTQLEQSKGIRLAIRLGVHTGLVVVGEMGGEGRHEQLALGETPNVAARIQGLAEPDTLIVSDATYRLIHGYFDCESLGEHELRGVAQPIAVYRVLGDTGIQSRLDVAATRGLTPLVGRESETTLLFERWEQAKDGNGQVVLVSGEAGIGKSRLIQVLKDHIADEPHTRMECRSLPYFTNSALYPITDFLQRTLRFQTDDTPEQRLEKLKQNLRQYRLPLDETVPLFGNLLSLSVPEDPYPPLNLSPQRQRQKTLEAIVAITLELAERQTVLFILEDAHWQDPSTNEFLNLLMDQTPTATLLLLITCRPEFQSPWQHRSYLTEMTINRLSRDQIERMAQQVAGGKGLPAEIIQQLVDKTDGVPLYVEEMTKAVMESGMLKEEEARFELTGSIASLSIPATLQDSLMARLDRLMTAKVVAQLGATIGRQFSYDLLYAVAQLDEPTLQRELGRLVEAELVYQRGLPPQATYTFKHALIQDTAYESLLRSTRQGYHRRIAEVLEERFSEIAENQPELLAHHYSEAQLNEQAVGYWYKAGQRASEHSAMTEAIAHFRNGLKCLNGLPNTIESAQCELDLLIGLGSALTATQGYSAPDVEHTYHRARELCQQVDEAPQRFPILAGLRRFYTVTSAFEIGQELGDELLRLAARTNHLLLWLEAYFALGNNAYWQGEFVTAHKHFTQGRGLDIPNVPPSHISLYGQDPRVACLVYAAVTSWLLGYPEKALRQSESGLAIAQASSHLNTLAYALCWSIFVYQFRRDVQATRMKSEVLITLSEEQQFRNWLSHGTVFQGWARAIHGQREGLVQMEQAIAARVGRVPGRVSNIHQFALLAQGYQIFELPGEGLSILAETLSSINSTDTRYYEAELHRLKGQLLLQQSPDNATEAESCFQQAISIAQNQSAKSWELRAATSLAKLWQQQGKRQEAYDLLAPVYGWFTEGFDTADLIDAKTLLNELG